MVKISGSIVDVVNRNIIRGIISIENDKIVAMEACDNVDNQYIIPGFVDAHIHIESSMMVPSEFARHSIIHGTVACVCDPHEIANVCGIDGIDFMIQSGLKSPLKYYFGAPSCVPATPFDSGGAVLDANTIEELLLRDDIHFLAEMMDYPGVIKGDTEVMRKIATANNYHKPIDGHAPELRGKGLEIYVASGISTDHECISIAEAEEKIKLGMKILIREGSAAKNFDVLLPLLEKHADKIMFCSDDKHPDDLISNGHINTLARRAVAAGYPPIEVLRICSLNPIKHYSMNIGLLQNGDLADFVIVDNLSNFNIKSTYINGRKVAENGKALFERQSTEIVINNFNAEKITISQLKVEPKGKQLKVITVNDGQLFTHCEFIDPKIEEGNIVSDIENDVLKLVVYNRYQPSKPAVGFIKNIGLKEGAMASTVAHDNHNIIAVGTSDTEIASAINQIIDSKGGILVCKNDKTILLPLPVAGLMSNEDGETIALRYEAADKMAKQMGSQLNAPFMTLAFMSLLVIPTLKLTDKGLFDGINFSFTDLMT